MLLTLLRAVHWAVEKTRLQWVRDGRWGNRSVQQLLQEVLPLRRGRRKGDRCRKGWASECTVFSFLVFRWQRLNMFMSMEGNREEKLPDRLDDWWHKFLRWALAESLPTRSASYNRKEGGGWRCRKVLSIWWQKVEGIPIYDGFYLPYEIGVELILEAEGLLVSLLVDHVIMYMICQFFLSEKKSVV